MLFISGCSHPPPTQNQVTSPYKTGAETYTARDRYFGFHPMTQWLSGKKDYGDHYIGNRTPVYHGNSVKNFNIGHDQDMMRYTVHHTSDFKPGAIAVIGSHAWVNVKYTGSRYDMEKEVAKLKATLATQMPRYTIHVRVTNR